jgi:hypothetical protein
LNLAAISPPAASGNDRSEEVLKNSSVTAIADNHLFWQGGNSSLMGPINMTLTKREKELTEEAEATRSVAQPIPSTRPPSRNAGEALDR